MKRFRLLAAAIAATISLSTAIPVSGQERETPGLGSLEHITYKSYIENKESLSDIIVSSGFTANGLIGARVMDVSGKEVGAIEDLGIGSDGQLEKLIVSVGGFLGIGVTHVAVDISTLRYGTSRTGVVSSMTAEELESLPGYTLLNRNWIRSDTQ